MWISFLSNCAIVIMVAFSFAAMFLGWDFMGKEGNFSSPGLRMFRYFTIDSNVLAGVCSLTMALAEIPVLIGRAEALAPVFYAIKLMGASAVMLTLMVTVCFLMPQNDHPLVLFYNSNLFFHLIVPLLSAGSFVFAERAAKLPIKATLLGALPTLLYAIFYLWNVFSHLEEGKIVKKYDFYNFMNGKKERAPIVIIVVFLVSYLLTLLLWWGNCHV